MLVVATMWAGSMWASGKAVSSIWKNVLKPSRPGPCPGAGSWSTASSAKVSTLASTFPSLMLLARCSWAATFSSLDTVISL